MSFFVNTGPDAKARLNQLIGTSAATGLSRNFQTPETRVQRGMLEDAFKKLENAPKGDFVSQFKEIAPAFMSTSGGAELLSTLAPLLQKQALGESYKEVLGKGKAGQQPINPQENQQEVKISKQPSKEFEEKAITDSALTNQLDQVSEKSLFPARTAPSLEQPIKSFEQMQDMVDDLASRQLAATGQVNYPELWNTVNSINDQAIKSNELAEAQKKRILEENKEWSQGLVQRAENSGLYKPEENPEDRTIIESLSSKHRHEGTPDQVWKKVRPEYEQVVHAREQIKRVGDLAGPFSKIWRKALGNYKDKETIMNDVRSNMEPFIENGLYDQLREVIQDSTGFGPDDIERTIFKMTDDQEKGANKFSSNKIKPESSGYFSETFPGADYNLPKEDFLKFKENLSDYLKKYPEVNLINLRTLLNQEKKYSWEDYNKAINQLISERSFTPSQQQNVQKGVIQNAPMPGLAEMFKYQFTGRQ